MSTVAGDPQPLAAVGLAHRTSHRGRRPLGSRRRAQLRAGHPGLARRALGRLARRGRRRAAHRDPRRHDDDQRGRRPAASGGQSGPQRRLGSVRGTLSGALPGRGCAQSGVRRAGRPLVTDRSSGGSAAQRAARQGQAQAFAGDICQRAAQLVALDQQVAGKITAAVAGIRDTFPRKPQIQAVDNHTFKQDTPHPYPLNEVIAEATDLDGNHVVLRRGYYDERTQQGFGWDKAYWRHHVVNPNVFRDLISHARPISKEGGVLVYEVPINRVHCTRVAGNR